MTFKLKNLSNDWSQYFLSRTFVTRYLHNDTFETTKIVSICCLFIYFPKRNCKFKTCDNVLVKFNVNKNNIEMEFLICLIVTSACVLSLWVGIKKYSGGKLILTVFLQTRILKA